MTSIPVNATDFTVDWLNEVLEGAPSISGARVVSCEARDSEIPGQTAEIVLLNVGFDSDDPDLPNRMVAKVTSRNPDILKLIIANYDQYRRETSFYREFPDVGIPVPECLYEFHDPQTQNFIILMRDLAPAECPSWAVTPSQVEDALSQLPAFHAKWWNDPGLRSKDWIVQPDNAAFYGAAAGAGHGAGPALSDLYDDPELTREANAIFLDKTDRVLAFLQTRPLTFVHGDFHAKQMFFPSEAGGNFAVIDWQFPYVAPGPWDFARMTGMCLSTDDRQANEKRLQDAYRDGLATCGIDGYSREEFETDYRFGLFISQLIMSIASADTDPEILRVECEALGVDWKDVMFHRTQRAMAEWDVVGLLKQI